MKLEPILELGTLVEQTEDKELMILVSYKPNSYRNKEGYFNFIYTFYNIQSEQYENFWDRDSILDFIVEL